MIRTKKYIIVKFIKYRGKWIPVKINSCVDIYCLRDAKIALEEVRDGSPGHSSKCKYKIMEICYCDSRSKQWIKK